MKHRLRPQRSVSLLPGIIRIAMISRNRVIAVCTPLTVVSRSSLMSLIITFMFEPAKLQMNWASASGRINLPRRQGRTLRDAPEAHGAFICHRVPRPCRRAAFDAFTPERYGPEALLARPHGRASRAPSLPPLADPATRPQPNTPSGSYFSFTRRTRSRLPPQ